MLEIKMFEKLLNIIEKHEGGNFLADREKKISFSYFHDNKMLVEFYNYFNFNKLIIQTGFSSISFIDYSKLKEKNNTYSFSKFKEEYIVFAEQPGGGSPILFNFINNNSPSIYAAYDVTEPFMIATNFYQFIEALTVLVDIVYNEYDIYEIYTNDDCDEVKPDFLPKIKLKLSPILGENIDNFMRYFLG